MTSDPAAPDSPAVYLFREEIVNDKLHSHTTYARIKILTEKGKEKFSEIEIPYEKGESGETISNVEGRTIEPDGTIVPFTGKPFNKEVVKSGDVTVMAKVFSLPDIWRRAQATPAFSTTTSASRRHRRPEPILEE